MSVLTNETVHSKTESSSVPVLQEGTKRKHGRSLQVVVARKSCGCVCGVETCDSIRRDPKNLMAWIREGYQLSIEDGPIQVPQLCPEHEAGL